MNHDECVEKRWMDRLDHWTDEKHRLKEKGVQVQFSRFAAAVSDLIVFLVFSFVHLDEE